jgi:aminopeptidase YwaD
MIKTNERKKVALICITFTYLLLLLSSTFVYAQVKQNYFFPWQITSDDLTNLEIQYKKSFDILSMILQVNESILNKHVEIIQDFGPHPTGSEACEAVGEYLYNELSLDGLSVEYDPWIYKGYNSKNVVATLDGSGLSDGVAIICAHYDSVPVSPGADDDGSGVAAVLTIAKIMSGYSFNCTIRFVLFSGEEQGMLGSKKYVEEISENKDNIIGVLCLDGIGYANTSEDGGKVKHYANDQSDWMVDISEEIACSYFENIGLEVLRLLNKKGSDHQSFIEYGYDASFLWKNITNPYRHTSEDNINNVNITYLTKVCRLALGTFTRIACLDPLISDDDLKISVKGSVLTYPAQLYVKIENLNYIYDTANVTIQIQIKNLLTGVIIPAIIKKPGTILFNWSYNKEIKEYWEFKTSSKKYTRQFFKFEVMIKGFNDDIGLYKKQCTFGVIVHPYVLLLVPRF